jgi:hypothetical protein
MQGDEAELLAGLGRVEPTDQLIARLKARLGGDSAVVEDVIAAEDREEAEGRARRLRLLSVDLNHSPPVYSLLVEFEEGADGYLVPQFQPEQEPSTRRLLEQTLGTRFTAEDLRRQFSVSSLLHVVEAGQPDPSGNEEPDDDP